MRWLSEGIFAIPMNPESEYLFLKAGPFALPYRKFGSGPELLLAFHGFGRSSEDFRAFEGQLGNRYTIIAFDFFYHGPLSISPKQRIPVFNPAHMSEMVEKLLWENKKVRCSMIGYSQGGRIVMGIIHRLPHRINELFLLAPDGMKVNKVRKFVGTTTLGRKLGAFLSENPNALKRLVAFLSVSGFITKKQKQFYLSQLSTDENRWRVYHTWLALRNYYPHPGLIRHYINKRNIRTEIFLGRFDSVIPLSIGKHFCKKLGRKAQLHILDCGHDLMARAEDIGNAILSKPLNSAVPTDYPEGDNLRQ